ncbi:hypothetical protein N9Y12_04305, partial [Candidatus Pelagibacter bacterium]
SYLVIFFILKIFFVKCINSFNLNLEKAHKFSTLFSVIFFVIVNFYYLKMNLDEVILIILNIFVFSYVFITFPGGYASSVRLKILSKLINKNRSKKYFKSKFSDRYLFQDRFSRLQRYDLIFKKNKKYYLRSKQIYFFIKFINLNKLIFKKIKK